MMDEVLKKARTIAIYGNVGSGKTALAYSIIDKIKGNRQVFFYRHPWPSLIEPLGYRNIITLEQIHKLKGSIIYIDEPQFHFGIYNKRAYNKALMTLLQMSRQYNITLIMSSSDTRVFGKGAESYFDLWLVKNVDYDMVKQGSKIKKILEDNSLFGDPAGIQLNVNEFFAYNKEFSDEVCGKRFSFNLPSYFTDVHSKAYAYETPTETPTKLALSGATSGAPKCEVFPRSFSAKSATETPTKSAPSQKREKGFNKPKKRNKPWRNTNH